MIEWLSRLFAKPKPGLPVYAYAGERVTCENGHHICTFVKTTYWGAIQNPRKEFGEWQQPEPRIGQIPIPPCDKCGALWAIPGGIFHFKDGWRDRPCGGL